MTGEGRIEYEQGFLTGGGYDGIPLEVHAYGLGAVSYTHLTLPTSDLV